MGERYQWNKGGGWTAGQATFPPIWDRTSDLLRFHMGDRFVITELGVDGPERSLKDIGHYLPKRVQDAPLDRVLEVRSQKDGYSIKYRRHQVGEDKGALVLAHAAERQNTPYIYGLTDCSWLTMACYGEEGVNLPHNSRAQFADPQVLQIPRAKLLPGDLLLIHNGEHVALYRDPKTVWDTEPHDAPAPDGGMQGVGVQIRSTNPGYYCGTENWDACGRIAQINGVP